MIFATFRLRQISAHLQSRQQIEESEHIAELIERKAQAHAQKGMGRLTQAVPASAELLERAAERGEIIGAMTSAPLRLVDRYGQEEVQAAVLTALARGVPHPNAVRLALETQREARHQPPPVAICLSAQAACRDTVVKPHRPDSYDQLTHTGINPGRPDQTKGDQDES